MISCGFLLEGTIMTRHLGLAVARPLSISAGHNSKAGWRKKTMRIWKGCDLLGSMIVRRGFTLTCSECGPEMQRLGKVEEKKSKSCYLHCLPNNAISLSLTGSLLVARCSLCWKAYYRLMFIKMRACETASKSCLLWLPHWSSLAMDCFVQNDA